MARKGSAEVWLPNVTRKVVLGMETKPRILEHWDPMRHHMLRTAILVHRGLMLRKGAMIWKWRYKWTPGYLQTR